jgi:hypothetical protein
MEKKLPETNWSCWDSAGESLPLRRTPARLRPAWNAASSVNPGVPSRNVRYLSWENSDQFSWSPPLTQQFSSSPTR